MRLLPPPSPSFLRDRRGVAALEFAAVAPVMLMVLALLVDFGFAVERAIRLETAARAGAQFAVVFPNDPAGMRAAALAQAGGVDATAPLPAMVCACPDSAGEVTVAPTAATCGTTCATGLARYIDITVNRPFTPIFPHSGFLNFGWAATASVRARLS